jgi:hypothetical protein
MHRTATWPGGALRSSSCKVHDVLLHNQALDASTLTIAGIDASDARIALQSH